MQPLALKESLAAVGYYCDDGLATEVALLLNQDSDMIRTMLLDGPPGSGKTFLAKSVAKVLGVPYVYIQAHAGSSPEDFLHDANVVTILRGAAGDRTAVKSPEDVINFGFMPTIFNLSKKGRIVGFVDELDKASPKVDAFFLTALQEAEVVVRGLKEPIAANVTNLTLFFTKNNEREVSEALMRRCRRVYLKFPDPDLEMKILLQAQIPRGVAEVLTQTAAKLRTKHDDLIKVPATQELIMAGRDVVQLGKWGMLHLAGEVAYRWLAAYTEDQAILKKVITAEALCGLLRSAYKSEAVAVTRGDIGKTDDSFVKFGK